MLPLITHSGRQPWPGVMDVALVTYGGLSEIKDEAGERTNILKLR